MIQDDTETTGVEVVAFLTEMLDQKNSRTRLYSSGESFHTSSSGPLNAIGEQLPLPSLQIPPNHQVKSEVISPYNSPTKGKKNTTRKRKSAALEAKFEATPAESESEEEGSSILAEVASSVKGRKALSNSLPPLRVNQGNTSPPSENPQLDWTVQQVGDWLESIGCSNLRTTFEQAEIDGQVLSSLNKTELKEELGIKVIQIKSICFVLIWFVFFFSGSWSAKKIGDGNQNFTKTVWNRKIEKFNTFKDVSNNKSHNTSEFFSCLYGLA